MAKTRLSQPELIVMLAMIFATVAFSIDSMLPALPSIAAELTPDDPNQAQLIITSFIFGMGFGTFFSGPLSDTFGRKPVIIAGAALYITGALLTWAGGSLELVLAGRVVQGLGGAGPRVAVLAIIRDLYSGRDMARIMSFIMMIFTLVPALAPSMGSLIIADFGWRGIFMAYVLFSFVSVTWMGLRLDEPLAPENRRSFRPRALGSAVAELFAHPVVRISIFAQTLCAGQLFTMISMVQPVYDVTFGKADTFPYWFGGVAIVAGSASLVNAALVNRLGMRFLIIAALSMQIVLSGTMIVLTYIGLPEDIFFACFLVWQASLFFQAALTLGNLNALGMEPVGHIAGMAASVIGAVSTVGASILAAPVGLAFNGTPMPLALAIFIEASLACGLMLYLRSTYARPKVRATSPAETEGSVR